LSDFVNHCLKFFGELWGQCLGAPQYVYFHLKGCKKLYALVLGGVNGPGAAIIGKMTDQ